jgi:glycosyltransferase involved in cell wall biosynthesis
MPEPPQLLPIATQPLSVLLLGNSDRPGLETTLGKWFTHLYGLGREVEVLLVDDALTDRTAELANSHPTARVLRDPIRRGVGAALRLGLTEARHPLFLQVPCDGRYQPADVQKLLAEIDRVHLVVGHCVGRPVPLPLRLLGGVWRLTLRILFGLPLEPLPAWLGWRGHARNLLAHVVFGLRLHDVTCDFRLFRREVFRRIPIQSDGTFVHVEVLAKANFLGQVMSEAAVTSVEQWAPASWWREAWRVFAHPDFGPARLPDEPAPSASAPENAAERRDDPS